MPNDIISIISNWIITLGAIAGALMAIYKIIYPMTIWGKKQREKKRIQRDEEVKEMARVIANEKRDEAQQTSQKIIDANNAKIEASFNTISEHLSKVDNQLANVMLINAEQTKTIEHMNEKIDTNEIDRLRWEIISFANSLRYDDGQSATLEGYNHVFDAYGKYEKLLEALGRKNGKIDNEYAYIKIMYNEFSKNYSK